MAMTPDQQYVMETMKTRDVHFVRFWFTDVMGRMKSFAVSPNEIENAFSDGMGFDGSSVEGFTGTGESDILAYPDATTFQILPWRPEHAAVARMFCTIKTPDGEPFEADPRQVLMRVVKKAARMGYTANMGPEVEYFYFKDSSHTELLDHGGYFDLTSLDSATDMRRDTVLALEDMGIPVEYSHHECAPSQNEVDLRFSDALSMADAVMTYKLVVKEVAKLNGVYATFMPKPLEAYPGSGMHVHQSLFDMDGNNVFFDPHDPLGYNLSETAKHYIAGLLKYAPEFSLLTNQYVNSYKRLVPGGEAPICISWGRANRSTLVRIPGYRPNREVACRVELRSPDPACNPYLAFAAMIMAGLKGIEDELPLRAPVEGRDLAKSTRQELTEEGAECLPENLGQAVELFAHSDLMRELLGERTHKFLVDQKREEWNQYSKMVSDWELHRYLEVL